MWEQLFFFGFFPASTILKKPITKTTIWKMSLTCCVVSGSMNHYSDQYGGYDAGAGRMSGMGYSARYDEANMVYYTTIYTF